MTSLMNNNKNMPKNLFCRSVTGQGGCRAFNGKCRFAHTIEELYPTLCKYGDRCNRFTTDPFSCKFVHPSQDINDYAQSQGFMGCSKKGCKRSRKEEFVFEDDGFPRTISVKMMKMTIDPPHLSSWASAVKKG